MQVHWQYREGDCVYELHPMSQTGPSLKTTDIDKVTCEICLKLIDVVKKAFDNETVITDGQSYMRKPHREICALCHEVSRVGFWVPNEIWAAAVHPHYQNSIICLRCFGRWADERSVEWDKEIKFFPVSWITHSELLKGGRSEEEEK